MKRFVLLIVLLVVFFVPSIIYAFDFPQYKGYVNDFENILDNDTELENILSNLEKETTVEIAVVTVSDFQGSTFEDFAVKLFENWKIGKKDVDNGLLIIVSKEQRQSRFEVGYGLEGTLPDALTGRIQDEYMIPYFKNDDYSKGVLEGINATIGIIKKDPTVISNLEKPVKSNSINEAFIYVGLIVFYFLSFSKSWWLGGLLGAGYGVYAGISSQNPLSIFYYPVIWGVFGLIIDFLLSRTFLGSILRSTSTRGFSGTSRGGSSGGMSFGGGSSGGGGSSRSW